MPNTPNFLIGYGERLTDTIPADYNLQVLRSVVG